MNKDFEKRLEKYRNKFREMYKSYTQEKIEEQAELAMRFADRDPKVRRNNFGEFVEDK